MPQVKCLKKYMFEIFSVINSPEIQSSLLFIKIPMGIIAVLFAGFIIFGLFRTSWLLNAYFSDFAEFFTFRSFGIRRMTRAWQNIQVRLETQNEDEYKLAVTEADHILSNVLRRMNISGQETEEKLNTLTPAIITNLEDLKRAHISRNNIVHDPDYRLSLDKAKSILEVYEKTFQSLDLI